MRKRMLLVGLWGLGTVIAGCVPAADEAATTAGRTDRIEEVGRRWLWVPQPPRLGIGFNSVTRATRASCIRIKLEPGKLPLHAGPVVEQQWAKHVASKVELGAELARDEELFKRVPWPLNPLQGPEAEFYDKVGENVWLSPARPFLARLELYYAVTLDAQFELDDTAFDRRWITPGDPAYSLAAFRERCGDSFVKSYRNGFVGSALVAGGAENDLPAWSPDWERTRFNPRITPPLPWRTRLPHHFPELSRVIQADAVFDHFVHTTSDSRGNPWLERELSHERFAEDVLNRARETDIQYGGRVLVAGPTRAQTPFASTFAVEIASYHELLPQPPVAQSDPPAFAPDMIELSARLRQALRETLELQAVLRTVLDGRGLYNYVPPAPPARSMGELWATIEHGMRRNVGFPGPHLPLRYLDLDPSLAGSHAHAFAQALRAYYFASTDPSAALQLQQTMEGVRAALDDYARHRIARIASDDPAYPAPVMLDDLSEVELPVARRRCERKQMRLPRLDDAQLLGLTVAAARGFWLDASGPLGTRVAPDCYLARNYAVNRGDGVAIECAQQSATVAPPRKIGLCVPPMGAAPQLPPI
jgi:hypothetical protein